MLKIRVFLLCCIIGSLSNYCYAQASHGLWLGASAEKTLIKKKLSANLESGIRYASTFRGFNKKIIEPGLSFKLNKKINLDGSYRFTNATSKLENRFTFAIKWSDKFVKRTYISTKIKYQTEKSSNERNFENTGRLKIGLKHKIKKKKLYPYIYSEFFYSLNPSLYGFNNARFGGGISIKSFKNQDIKIGYFRGTDFSKETSKKRNIFGIGYNIKFK